MNDSLMANCEETPTEFQSLRGSMAFGEMSRYGALSDKCRQAKGSKWFQILHLPSRCDYKILYKDALSSSCECTPTIDWSIRILFQLEIVGRSRSSRADYAANPHQGACGAVSGSGNFLRPLINYACRLQRP